MSLVTRRYRSASPTTADLQGAVSASASVVAEVGSTVVDIEVDDLVADVVATLDEYMKERGFIFQEAAPPAATTLRLRSPDGTEWAVGIDNAGALGTNAV